MQQWDAAGLQRVHCCGGRQGRCAPKHLEARLLRRLSYEQGRLCRENEQNLISSPILPVRLAYFKILGIGDTSAFCYCDMLSNTPRAIPLDLMRLSLLTTYKRNEAYIKFGSSPLLIGFAALDKHDLDTIFRQHAFPMAGGERRRLTKHGSSLRSDSIHVMLK